MAITVMLRMLCLLSVAVATSDQSAATMTKMLRANNNHGGMMIQQRDLQDSRLWDISTPAISYSGMQLDMEYTVRDQVRTSDVRVDFFRNEDCTGLVDDSEYSSYLTLDIINDLTAYGDGSSTRKVRTKWQCLHQKEKSSHTINSSSDYRQFHSQSQHHFPVPNYFSNERSSHCLVLC